ncbi:UNVERIFIED_CONTAM: Retrovirus-related Pol polyprotein from transposon RE1 [Sesamum latifolium]|uniref:Retrovirus-related Pol polyprotein from transposon RE1 n=1 Tax=Sesamum latifolium TaxID=2727402 RepID=A0AAW2X550_9LAMI
MEIARSSKGISVSQRKYVLDLLKETGMTGCKPVDTPMDPNMKLGTQTSGTVADRGRNQQLMGKHIYRAHTRLDIGFSISVVSQFMNNPSEEHMQAVYGIIRYLKSNPGKWLFFRKATTRTIDAFTDVD